MPWWQFLRWAEYANLDPFGDHRDDMRMWTLASIVMGCAGNKKAGGMIPDLYKGKGELAKRRASRRKPDKQMTDPTEWQKAKSRRAQMLKAHMKQRRKG